MGYNKCKAGVDKFGEMLPLFHIPEKSNKLKKKFFFHLFDLCMVNAHILHSKKNRNLSLELFYELVAEGLLSDAGQDIREWARSTSASKLTGRDHCP
jgi:hypothetical protein